MKKFMFACIALMCLVVAYHFGAPNAQGQSPGSIRFIGQSGSDPLFATSSGIYIYDRGWFTLSSRSYPTPPVPVDQIIYDDGSKVVTSSGEGYHYINGSWQSSGIVPGGPTPAIQTTFGALKAKYR